MATELSLACLSDRSEVVPEALPPGPHVLGQRMHWDVTPQEDEPFLSRMRFGHSARETTTATLVPIYPRPSGALARSTRLQSQREMESRPLEVLAVDDCPDTCASFQELFAMWGYRCRTAHNGASALATVERCYPDVILMDIVLPDLDGVELLGHIRRLGSYQPTVICLSAWDNARTRSRAWAAGCDQFLAKPLELPVLQELLNSINHLRHLDQSQI